MSEFGPEWYQRVVVQGAIDREWDCHCWHGPEAHAVDLVLMERGKCLKKDCGCLRYKQNEKSSFFKLLELVDGVLNREKKREALFAEIWSLEDWLWRFRGTPWPEKTGAKE
jgi:hypothetical protein